MKCMNCQKTITPFRKNKKYCNTSCRVDHHNKISRLRKRKWEIFQNELENNYQILLELYQKKSNWSYQDIENKGFKPHFFTHLTPHYKEWKVINIYDFNIWLHPNQWVLIAFSDLTNFNNKPFPSIFHERSLDQLLAYN